MPTEVIDKPKFMDDLDEESKSDLTNDHGWPHTLCVIEVRPGMYACNNVDTKNLEDPPQIIDGLAVFMNEDSAKSYMGELNGLSGTIVPKTFNECRKIVEEKEKITALLLMDGNKVIDIIHVK